MTVVHIDIRDQVPGNTFLCDPFERHMTLHIGAMLYVASRELLDTDVTYVCLEIAFDVAHHPTDSEDDLHPEPAVAMFGIMAAAGPQGHSSSIGSVFSELYCVRLPRTSRPEDKRQGISDGYPASSLGGISPTSNPMGRRAKDTRQCLETELSRAISVMLLIVLLYDPFKGM